MSENEPEEEPPRPAAVEEEEAPSSDDADRESPPAAEPKLPTVPTFALSFPHDPALDDLVEAFEKGNYARVRREAPLLVKRSDRVEVRRAARELARRVHPDPLSVYLLVAASLLLIFLALWYWTHPHEAP